MKRAAPSARSWDSRRSATSPAPATNNCTSPKRATRICGGGWSPPPTASLDRSQRTVTCEATGCASPNAGARTRRNAPRSPWRANSRCCCTPCGRTERTISPSVRWPTPREPRKETHEAVKEESISKGTKAEDRNRHPETKLRARPVRAMAIQSWHKESAVPRWPRPRRT